MYRIKITIIATSETEKQKFRQKLKSISEQKYSTGSKRKIEEKHEKYIKAWEQTKKDQYVSKGQHKINKAQTIFEDRITQIFLKLKKYQNIQIQETQVLYRICKNKFTLRHIPSEIAKSLKSENLKSNQRAEYICGNSPLQAQQISLNNNNRH